MAPVLIFTYKKLAPLKLAVAALQKNTLAGESELIIFSDGPKNGADIDQIDAVRAFVMQIEGFKKVTVHTSDQNRGLAASIIGGISETLKTFDTVIVLEDDLVTSTNFLDFMNQGLDVYKNDQRVHSIAGYTVPVKTPEDYPFDNYFTQRASSWGWATWKDRWNKVDWEISDYADFAQDKTAQRKFNAMGSDMSAMLAKQIQGKISSWAIRWCYHQFKYGLYAVYPTISKISNIGFGADATHTKGSTERYATPLDVSGKEKFNFNPNPELKEPFTTQFVSTFSIKTRLYYKIKNFLGL